MKSHSKLPYYIYIMITVAPVSFAQTANFSFIDVKTLLATGWSNLEIARLGVAEGVFFLLIGALLAELVQDTYEKIAPISSKENAQWETVAKLYPEVEDQRAILAIANPKLEKQFIREVSIDATNSKAVFQNLAKETAQGFGKSNTFVYGFALELLLTGAMDVIRDLTNLRDAGTFSNSTDYSIYHRILDKNGYSTAQKKLLIENIEKRMR